MISTTTSGPKVKDIYMNKDEHLLSRDGIKLTKLKKN